jgi:hypothetical protein
MIAWENSELLANMRASKKFPDIVRILFQPLVHPDHAVEASQLVMKRDQCIVCCLTFGQCHSRGQVLFSLGENA